MSYYGVCSRAQLEKEDSRRYVCYFNKATLFDLLDYVGISNKKKGFGHPVVRNVTMMVAETL